MGKKSRRIRDRSMSKNTIKSLNDRKEEVFSVKNKIHELGFGEGNPDIKSFFLLLDEYIKNEESYQGRININGHQRIIEYVLPKYSKNQCQVKMVYDKAI